VDQREAIAHIRGPLLEPRYKNELDSVPDTIYAAVEERKSHLHLRDGAEGIGG
jgi:hypothetical protein